MEDDRYIKVAIRDYIDKEVGHMSSDLIKEVKHMGLEFNLINEKNQEALRLAQKNLDYKLVEMNGVRDQLKDQAGQFISKQEFVITVEALKSDIKVLQRFVYIAIGGFAVIELLIRFVVK